LRAGTGDPTGLGLPLAGELGVGKRSLLGLGPALPLRGLVLPRKLGLELPEPEPPLRGLIRLPLRGLMRGLVPGSITT
jgi:hypothetical protein